MQNPNEVSPILIYLSSPLIAVLVVKEPPYTVKESGYGCFLLPIEVYFKNKDEPRKVRFEYDLFLQSEGRPIHHVRYEKMTFKNPSEDFRRKLILGGGVRAHLFQLQAAPWLILCLSFFYR